MQTTNISQTNSLNKIPTNSLEFQREFERIKKNTNYYEILGILKTASPNDIKREYKRLSLLFHPDKAFIDTKDEFQNIEQAYRVLNDPVKRQEYNSSLGLLPAPPSNKVGPPEGCTYFFRTEMAPCKGCGKELNLYSEPFPFFCPFCRGITNLLPPANYSKNTYNLGEATVGITPQGIIVTRKDGELLTKSKKRKRHSSTHKKHRGQDNSSEEGESKKEKKPRRKKKETKKNQKANFPKKTSTINNTDNRNNNTIETQDNHTLEKVKLDESTNTSLSSLPPLSLMDFAAYHYTPPSVIDNQ